MGFSFLILDVFLRYFSNQYVDVYGFTHASPLFFSVSWIFLFIMIFYLFPKKAKMIAYATLNIIFNILTLAQILHMKILNRFFGLSDVLLVGEGADYFGYALSNIDFFTCVLVGVSIISMLLTLLLMKKAKEFKRNISYFSIVLLSGILLFAGFRVLAIDKLGEAVDAIGWDAAYNVKNIYLDFNNQSKNMEVAGFYEQTFRNSYLFIKENVNLEKDKLNQELDSYFEENGILMSSENSYTGLLAGKNLIFVLMESIDSFVVTEDVMPTLTNLQNTGLNFTNRYAPSFGGGQTINSEFAANTGLYAVNNSKAIYNFDNNNFSYSLARLLKKEGYTVNSLHANNGKFYNRTSFHQALGYTNHYALSDMKELEDSYNYFFDSSLVKSKQVLELILPQEEPFMTYITTYSAHLPYDESSDRCSNMDEFNIDGNTELSCVRNLAHDTDEFLRLLIEELEERQILEDTVLVLFSDHYMYGYSNEEALFAFKNVDNTDLLQNVPFVIWNSNLAHQEINTLMDTADIVPTVLNLFGISYPTSYYIGTDVFSDNHDSFVYFSENTFYDGKFYYDGKEVTDPTLQEYVNDILKQIKNKMDLNNNILLGDYFQYLNQK